MSPVILGADRVHQIIKAQGTMKRDVLAKELGCSELVLRDMLSDWVGAGRFTARRLTPALGGAGPIVYGPGPRFAEFNVSGQPAIDPVPAPAAAPAPTVEKPAEVSPALAQIQLAVARQPVRTERKGKARAPELSIDFSQMVVRKNLPMPPAGHGNYERQSKWAQLLSKMEVGDMVEFPEGTASAVNKASQTYGRRTGRAYRLRKIMSTQNAGQPAVGLWRIEDPKPKGGAA